MKLALRLTALLAVIAAVVLPRGTAHDRVLLLVLEGARSEVVRELARAGHLPTLETIIAGGVGGDILATSGAASADRLLGKIVSVPAAADTDRPVPGRPLWLPLDRQARSFVLSGVPDAEAGEGGNSVVLPGPSTANGFIGMNAGLVVNRRVVEQNAVAWPYNVVSAELRAGAAAAVSADAVQWLRWQDPSGTDPRVGAFAVYALDGETLYLSPVYTRIIDDVSIPGMPQGVLYIGDDPTRVVMSSRVSEYLPRHAADLADARTLAAMTLAKSRPWELLVHVDRRIALTEVGVGQGPDAGRGGNAAEERKAPLVDAYKAVDAMVARWLDVAGTRTAVLVIGLAEQPEAPGEPVGWFAVASVVGDLGSWGPVTVEDLSATLSYLLSFRADRRFAPLPAIAARFPLRSRFNVRSFLEEPRVESVNADAKALQALLDKTAAF